MKIKCPLCLTELDCKIANYLYTHFIYEHHITDIRKLAEILAELIFKIHEKKQEKEVFVKEHPNMGRFHPVYAQIRLLESLLEEKK